LITLFALLGYIALQLAIGVWVSRRVRTENDYLLAGRTLGPVMTTATIFATWFGAETCVGAAGQVYEHGLSAVSSDPFGYALCLLLFGLFFASPLWTKGPTTLADLFRDRFSPTIERMVALLLIPGSLLWAAAQIRAFGQVLSAGSIVPEEAGIAIAAAIAITYTTFGGMLADATSDLIQGSVLIVCLCVLTAVVVADLGGAHQTLTLLQTPSAGAPLPSSSMWTTLNQWAVPVIGSLFAQELVSRSVSSRSASVARRSTLLAATIYLVVGCMPVLLGAIAHSTLPGVQPEQVLAKLADLHLGRFGYVIFAGAVISAIMSTVDSSLLACGALVSHNLSTIVLRDVNEAGKVRLARTSVVALGVLTYGLAHTADSVHGLVEQASAFGSAGICVTGSLGLFSRFGGARAALLSLLSGAGAWIVCDYVLHADAPYLCSLAAALLGYFGGAAYERMSAREATPK